jgi:hypothetical protein
VYRAVSAGILGGRMSRRSAVSKLAGAGGSAAVATARLGISRAAAQGAQSLVQSSELTNKKQERKHHD